MRKMNPMMCQMTGILIPANRKNLWKKVVTCMAADIHDILQQNRTELTANPILSQMFHTMSPQDKVIFGQLVHQLEAKVNAGEIIFEYTDTQEDIPENPNALQLYIL